MAFPRAEAPNPLDPKRPFIYALDSCRDFVTLLFPLKPGPEVGQLPDAPTAFIRADIAASWPRTADYFSYYLYGITQVVGAVNFFFVQPEKVDIPFYYDKFDFHAHADMSGNIFFEDDFQEHAANVMRMNCALITDFVEKHTKLLAMSFFENINFIVKPSDSDQAGSDEGLKSKFEQNSKRHKPSPPVFQNPSFSSFLVRGFRRALSEFLCRCDKANVIEMGAANSIIPRIPGFFVTSYSSDYSEYELSVKMRTIESLNPYPNYPDDLTLKPQTTIPFRLFRPDVNYMEYASDIRQLDAIMEVTVRDYQALSKPLIFYTVFTTGQEHRLVEHAKNFKAILADLGPGVTAPEMPSDVRDICQFKGLSKIMMLTVLWLFLKSNNVLPSNNVLDDNSFLELMEPFVDESRPYPALSVVPLPSLDTLILKLAAKDLVVLNPLSTRGRSWVDFSPVSVYSRADEAKEFIPESHRNSNNHNYSAMSLLCQLPLYCFVAEPPPPDPVGRPPSITDPQTETSAASVEADTRSFIRRWISKFV